MKKVLLLLAIILNISCSTNKFAASNKSYNKQVKALSKIISKKDTIGLSSNLKTNFVGTVNLNMRKPNFVIIHHTAQDSVAQTLKTFTQTKTQVSAHYVIGDDGQVTQMLNDYLRAWHAGSGIWGKVTDMNSNSIGIELDNNGTEPFSDQQINSLLLLLKKLKKTHNIPTQNFIGHSDIAPTRKSDPSIFFPWQKLAENGFGLWQDPVLVTAPANFDTTMALKIIGYDTKTLSSVIKAFKLHYVKTEINDTLDQNTIDIIYNIYKKQP